MEEKKLKILAIQMSSEIGDKTANFSKVRDLIEKNIKSPVDIIILPEVWTVGWKPSEFINSAEDLENSETIGFLSEIAKKYNVNIIGGSIICEQETVNSEQNFVSSTLTAHRSLHNTCPVINRKGELIATYDKMHLFSYYDCDEGKFVEEGEKPIMVTYCWDTNEVASCGQLTPSRQSLSRNDVEVGRAGVDVLPDNIKIGLSICYDIRFPEIYRAYRKAGADLLINMAAWPLSRAIHWEALTKARAIENQCFMVALTQSGLIEKDEWNLGHSRIIDYNGDVISEIKEGEGAIFAEIKFEEMYDFRKKCTILLDIHDSYDVE